MKKNIFIILLTAFMAISFAGCKNNGDIGYLFGTWRLETYTINGQNIEKIKPQNDSIPVTNVTFSFQNNVVNVVTVLDDYLSNFSQFGTWSQDDDTFTLDFTHVDAANPDGSWQYNAPNWIGMVKNQKMVMGFTENSSRSITLTWKDAQGTVRTYTLHKTW